MTAEERKDKIVESMHGLFMPNAGDIAHAAGMSESTVRRYLPELLAEHRVRHTSYVGLWAVNGGP